MPQDETRQRTGNRPELKLGPFPGGITVDVWLNEIKTQNGPRHVRSVTVSPRRYRDEDGQWKDASSYRPIDLGILILALQKAQDHCYTTPLPGGQPVQEEQGDGNIPF